MFDAIYKQLNKYLAVEEYPDIAFFKMGAFLHELPFYIRITFYIHTYTRVDGSKYRECFLALRLIKYIKYKLFMLSIKSSIKGVIQWLQTIIL